MAKGNQGKSRTGEKVKCIHGCGYETDHKGALNLHQTKHCKLIFKEEKRKKGSKSCCDNPEHELIPQNTEWGYIAVNNYGYKYYCKNCEEVFK